MSYRGRGSFNDRRGRGRGFRDQGYRPSISRDQGQSHRSRTPEWKRDNRDNFQKSSNWNDHNRDSWKTSNFRDDRRESDFNRSRDDDRRDDRNRNGGNFENDFRHKRKYSGEQDPYQSNRFDKGSNYSDRPSEFSTKRPHFESRGRGYRGSRSIYFSSRRDELYKERKSFRERNISSRSYERSGGSSGYRTDRAAERRNISNFISDIRNKTSSRVTTEENVRSPTREELEIESQVIDENLYETMTLDQRDYVASKALRILVTKPEGQCKLSELEYDLMDIKIMFVSSELFLEFLQSFMDDDNVFEILEPEQEEKMEDDNVKKSKMDRELKDEVKIKEEVKESTVDSAENKKKLGGNEGEKTGDDENELENEEDKDDIDKESRFETTIVVGRPKIFFCHSYITSVSSCSRSCGELHLCKFFLLSKCTAPEGRACCFRHSLDSDHNQKALRMNLLHTFSVDHIKTALKNLKYRNPSTLPPICWFYNSDKGCTKWQTVGCTFLHLCEKLLSGGTCPKEKKCTLNHDILKNNEVLARFGLWSPEYSKDDLVKVISENYLAYESYAKKYPDQPKDNKDDHYSKSGVTKAKWQLYIPSEEMWLDLTETCQKELESKHRAMIRAKDEYEETLEEMKQFKVKTLIGEKKEIPEISNKIVRRFVSKEDDNTSPVKTKITSKKEIVKTPVKEKEKEQEEEVNKNSNGKVKQEVESND